MARVRVPYFMNLRVMDTVHSGHNIKVCYAPVLLTSCRGLWGTRYEVREYYYSEHEHFKGSTKQISDWKENPALRTEYSNNNSNLHTPYSAVLYSSLPRSLGHPGNGLD